MKTLVVYFSRDGTTRTVAEELKALLGADIEEIREPRSRAGPVEWLRAGMEGKTRATPEINEPANDPSSYELVVIGTPVWAWNMASPVRSYLTKTKGKLPRVAFFCTAGSDPGATLKEMSELAGKQPGKTITLFTREVKEGEFREKMDAFIAKIKG